MSSQRDFSILDKIKFDYAPVGVKFSIDKPEGVDLLKGKYFSFPSNTIGSLLENLNGMELFPHWFDLGKEGFLAEREKREAELRLKLFGDPNKDGPDF